MLIGAEGGEDSCGSTGQGRPHRRKCAEEAPRHAREPLAAWSGNQPRLTQLAIKVENPTNSAESRENLQNLLRTTSKTSLK